MFDKQYRFYGKHAQQVDALTNVFGDMQSKTKMFNRNIDVLVNAPIVGFLYGRRAAQDNLKNPETNSVYTENVMDERVIKSSEDLWLRYRLIMLLDKEFESDPQKRVDLAFRETGDNPSGEARFNEYVRGGVEVLYEKLIKDATSAEDYAIKLSDFIDEFDDRFNSKINIDDITKYFIQ